MKRMRFYSLALMLISRIATAGESNEDLATDLLMQLRAAESGQWFVTRFEIKVNRPANVRGWLELSDQAGRKRVILAERVVRTASVWTRVEGSTSVSWKGAARLVFDVARTPERERPSYEIKAVNFQLDSDGDGLSDDEERAIGTDPAR